MRLGRWVVECGVVSAFDRYRLTRLRALNNEKKHTRDRRRTTVIYDRRRQGQRGGLRVY